MHAYHTTALWFTGPYHVTVRDEVLRPLGPSEVCVHTLVSGISHGTEMLAYRGQVPPTLALDLPTLAGSFAFPLKYGYAAVGEVIEVGAAVDRYRVGDLVFALHPHQQLLQLPTTLVARLPTGLDPLLGVFMANVETALTISFDTPLRLGETVVLFGQGVVGLLTLQLLRRAGAERVIVVEPIEQRRYLALSLGATAALVPSPDLPDEIRHLNAGRLADVAVEVSGCGAALQAAIEVVANEGTVVVASWYGSKPVTLHLGEHFHRGRVRLRSSQVGHLPPEMTPRWDYARRSALVASLLPQLALHELITHRFPFEAAADAYRLIDEHPAQVVQVVLTYV